MSARLGHGETVDITADRTVSARRAQILQDGQHATVIVGGFFEAETLQDPANVGFESLGTQVQPGQR